MFLVGMRVLTMNKRKLRWHLELAEVAGRFPSKRFNIKHIITLLL